MQENVQILHDAQQIAEHVCRILCQDTKKIPDFAEGSVPILVAARIYGKDASWVRAGIICGWLPIGYATREGKQVTDISKMDSKYGRINYYISPKKLWEDTGYVWKGEEKLNIL